MEEQLEKLASYAVIGGIVSIIVLYFVIKGAIKSAMSEFLPFKPEIQDKVDAQQKENDERANKA